MGLEQLADEVDLLRAVGRRHGLRLGLLLLERHPHELLFDLLDHVGDHLPLMDQLLELVDRIERHVVHGRRHDGVRIARKRQRTGRHRGSPHARGWDRVARGRPVPKPRHGRGEQLDFGLHHRRPGADVLHQDPLLDYCADLLAARALLAICAFLAALARFGRRFRWGIAAGAAHA